LYRALRALLDDGLIAESDARPEDDDERRRYYRLTPAGAARAGAALRRIARLVAIGRASGLLGNEP
jgi:DNA-binding PadR family transcriptional regulator